ncbi:MAG: hypothetical protein ACE14L_16345, partial [Terriglobales bacterium]
HRILRSLAPASVARAIRPWPGFSPDSTESERQIRRGLKPARNEKTKEPFGAAEAAPFEGRSMKSAPKKPETRN